MADREPGSPADDELARRALTDREAYAQLYDRYVRRIYRYCFRRLGEQQEAEDAISAIFLRALERLESYRGGLFAAWLFAIARTTVADRFRAPTQARLEDRDFVVDPAALPEEAAIAAADTSAERGLLSALSSDQREVLELRLAGLTGAEIAESMQRSVAAIKMLQLRAMRQLRPIAQATAGEDE